MVDTAVTTMTSKSDDQDNVDQKGSVGNHSSDDDMVSFLDQYETTMDRVLECSVNSFKSSIKTSLSLMMKKVLESGEISNFNFQQLAPYWETPVVAAGEDSTEKERRLKKCVMTLIAENNSLTGQLKKQQNGMLQLQRDLVREKIARSELMKVLAKTQESKSLLPRSSSNNSSNTPNNEHVWQSQENLPVNFGFFNASKNLDAVPSQSCNSNHSSGSDNEPEADPTHSFPLDTEMDRPAALVRTSFMDQLLPSSLLDSPSRLALAGPQLSNATVCQHCQKMTPADDTLAEFQLTPCRHYLCKSCVDDALSNPGDDADALLHCPFCQEVVLDVKLMQEAVTESPKSSIDLFPRLPGDKGHLSDIETVLDRFNGDVQKSIDYLLAEYAHAQTSSTGGNGSAEAPPPVTSFRNANTVCGPAGGPSLSNWKTEVCIYYLQGKCNKNKRTCSFAHGESDLVKPLNGTSLSVNAVAAGLKKGPVAPSPLHINANDAMLSGTTIPRSQNYKTELCYYFLKGCCNYSQEECRFAHGQEDLRKEGTASPNSCFPPHEGMQQQLQQQQQHRQNKSGFRMDHHQSEDLYASGLPASMMSLMSSSSSAAAVQWPSISSNQSNNGHA